MNRFSLAVAIAACGLSCAVLGCKTPANEAAPSTSASAKAPVASPSAPPAAPAKPWFSGNFIGDYQAKVAAVAIKVGALKEWGKDDGKLASGPGKLNLQIDDSGHVSGSSEGPLGEGQLSGKLEDDTLRVQLLPADDSGLHGVLIATRDGDGFKGSLEASSGDSLRVRTAAVTLKKQAN